MAAGTAYLRINTVMLPMAAIAMIANGALRDVGDTLPAMYSTLMTRDVVSVCLAWLLAFPLGLARRLVCPGRRHRAYRHPTGMGAETPVISVIKADQSNRGCDGHDPKGDDQYFPAWRRLGFKTEL